MRVPGQAVRLPGRALALPGKALDAGWGVGTRALFGGSEPSQRELYGEPPSRSMIAEARAYQSRNMNQQQFGKPA
jgi:hypothetical protein